MKKITHAEHKVRGTGMPRGLYKATCRSNRTIKYCRNGENSFDFLPVFAVDMLLGAFVLLQVWAALRNHNKTTTRLNRSREFIRCIHTHTGNLLRQHVQKEIEHGQQAERPSNSWAYLAVEYNGIKLLVGLICCVHLFLSTC